MDSDNLDVLLRTTDNTTMSLEQSKNFSNTKRKINSICRCIFRLHPATCTEKSCHSAGKNLPRYRISLPVITNIGKM